MYCTIGIQSAKGEAQGREEREKETNRRGGAVEKDKRERHQKNGPDEVGDRSSTTVVLTNRHAKLVIHFYPQHHYTNSARVMQHTGGVPAFYTVLSKREGVVADCPKVL